jgi:hypothetical protein
VYLALLRRYPGSKPKINCESLCDVKKSVKSYVRPKEKIFPGRNAKKIKFIDIGEKTFLWSF